MLQTISPTRPEPRAPFTLDELRALAAERLDARRAMLQAHAGERRLALGPLTNDHWGLIDVERRRGLPIGEGPEILAFLDDLAAINPAAPGEHVDFVLAALARRLRPEDR